MITRGFLPRLVNKKYYATPFLCTKKVFQQGDIEYSHIRYATLVKKVLK